MPEIARLAGTVSTWWPEIHAAITTGVTNAGSEGTNRVIKTDARCAFGYRNPANQRLRTRCATTRRARGHLTTRTSGPTASPETTQDPDDMIGFEEPRKCDRAEVCAVSPSTLRILTGRAGLPRMLE